ncbi:MAG TPA: hypothetical protein DD429_08635 [Clostridiaceae bacterium]|nr:hypothetical protein [Clostridiaceae bacterium]
MDDLDRMAAEAKKYNKRSLDKKKHELQKKVEEFEFKTLLDAVEFLFELRAKRIKTLKDEKLIKIIENVLRNEPFEYRDEDYILSSYADEQLDNSPCKKW